MSLEHYAVHIAPRGGKIDLIVDSIQNERENASSVRWAYAESKGAIGLYQNENGVSGLIFAAKAPLPEGWQKTSTYGEEDGVVAEPKSKDRTVVGRHAHLTRKAELTNLPRLPGAQEFSNRIGGSMMVLGAHESGRGFAMRSCYYERVGDITFVFTPWFTKQQETGNLADDAKVKTAFLPDGCERVGLSAYYLAKETTKPEPSVAQGGAS